VKTQLDAASFANSTRNSHPVAQVSTPRVTNRLAPRSNAFATAKCIVCLNENERKKHRLKIYPDKNRPPSVTGAKLPWFSRVESLIGGRAAWGRRCGCAMGEGLRCYRSAPVKEAAPWGGAAPWAAKLFSINRICTVLVRTRCGLPLSSWLVASAFTALPSATACMR
jgi:hypothetical protein